MPRESSVKEKYGYIPDNYNSLEQVTAALREAGLESTNLIIGIDFTASNGETGKFSFNNQSLHTVGDIPNPYENAIFIIGKTLSQFSKDNLIHCFGFGDKSTEDQKVFSFHSDHSPCHGFEEVLSCYKKIVPNLKLAGPTSYAPVIEAAIDIVEKSGGKHHVLLLIADGQVTRSVNTKDTELSPQEEKTIMSIVKASQYPLSIVLVGVGDGPWEGMKNFDDKIPLRDYDNFQFVNFTKIMSENETPSKKEAAFALAVLMEIPSQYKAAMELDILDHGAGRANTYSHTDGGASPQPQGPKSKNSEKQMPSPSLGSSLTAFLYKDLAKATNNFSKSYFLGEGGYGSVYKGILSDGQLVAVKQLKSGSVQGEKEFLAEVNIISSIHHKNLVSLVGYCVDDAHRMLVYEFVPNKTLDFHLHGVGEPTMSWPNRKKIALGSAKGLAYLHEDCHHKIIHRDIKAANILIDDNFDAKIADFGLARFLPHAGDSYSTIIMGTPGYVDPMYSYDGQLTDKLDVSSFVIVLLELITGFKPIGPNQPFPGGNMVEWAKPMLQAALKGKKFDDLIDKRLKRTLTLKKWIEWFSVLLNVCVYHMRNGQE